MTDTESKLSEIVSRVPDYMRRELLSSDPATRARAEETLSAMIANALASVSAGSLSRADWVPPAQTIRLSGQPEQQRDRESRG